MATLQQILASLNAQIVAATAGISVNSQSVAVVSAVGWPPEKLLQSIPGTLAGTPKVVVSVYDRRVVQNVTRWGPALISVTETPATVTAAVGSPPVLGLGDSVAITLGATVTPGDAAFAVISTYVNTLPVATAAGAIGGSGATPSTMATALAAAINGPLQTGFSGHPASDFVSAVAVGPVVTITNKTENPVKIEAHVGNGASELKEIGRRKRQVQIACWAPTQDIRSAATDPIDVMLAQAEIDFGWTMADGSVVRVNCEADFILEEDSLADVYRRDFLVHLEYPVTATDALYAVVAPVLGMAYEALDGEPILGGGSTVYFGRPLGDELLDDSIIDLGLISELVVLGIDMELIGGSISAAFDMGSVV